MAITLNPYLAFSGTAREAMTFYKDIFGGELTLQTVGESGQAENENGKDLVMHSELRNENFFFMASDGDASHPVDMGNNIRMSLSGDNEALLTNYFNGLSEGGTVDLPLAKQFWGDTFGMVTDKFGIQWMINISAAH